jgi:hypothetical protein
MSALDGWNSDGFWYSCCDKDVEDDAADRESCLLGSSSIFLVAIGRRRMSLVMMQDLVVAISMAILIQTVM